ncbi:hypothetical protein PI124_g16682 [Phytophthora idaei]|nr:hypothetical protein PI125_g19882 [Phytophthora idaei]KAG3135064.1 hypothetical protein PI126_g18412 [Phytophthora idaei]KAG3238353.1 hypothetical protein PI124_g16682 [Phytophthora idaei]
MDDCRPSKLGLQRYMDQYVLSNDDTDASANFISLDPQYRRQFYVPHDAIPQMMSLTNI